MNTGAAALIQFLVAIVSDVIVERGANSDSDKFLKDVLDVVKRKAAFILPLLPALMAGVKLKQTFTKKVEITQLVASTVDGNANLSIQQRDTIQDVALSIIFGVAAGVKV